MAKYLISDVTLADIAEAIREHMVEYVSPSETNGLYRNNRIFVKDMAKRIREIEGTLDRDATIRIDKNGVFDVVGYSKVDVDVPVVTYNDGSISTLWDGLQNEGRRVDYRYAFANGWTSNTFNPKYPIAIVENYADYMFYRSGVGSITNNVDFSGALTLEHTFDDSLLMRIDIDVSSAKSMDYTFNKAMVLTDIRIHNLSSSCSFNHTFDECNFLENLTIDGVIGQNGFDVSSSVALTEVSIVENILKKLEDKTKDNSGTRWVCVLGSENLGKLNEEEKAIAYNKGWDLE